MTDLGDLEDRGNCAQKLITYTQSFIQYKIHKASMTFIIKQERI